MSRPIVRVFSLLIAAVALALLLAACSDDDPAASPLDSGTPSITATPEDVSASGSGGETPGAGVEDCGVEDQGPFSEHDAARRECLWNAYNAGRSAAFTTTSYTMEGDPIAWHVAVISANEIRVSMDNTEDRFAGIPDRGVHTNTCTSISLGSDPAVPTALILSGCDTEGGYDIAI